MKQLKYRLNNQYIFVDGYIIINSWDIFKSDTSPLEDQRDKLIDILTEYAHMTSEKIILVFDGYMVKKSPGTIYQHKSIIVVYTKEFETADHFIEKELDRMGRVRRIRVATSDNIEQQIILSRGGSRISAREFEIEVERSLNKIQKKIKHLNKFSDPIGSLDEDLKKKLENLKKNIK